MVRSKYFLYFMAIDVFDVLDRKNIKYNNYHSNDKPTMMIWSNLVLCPIKMFIKLSLKTLTLACPLSTARVCIFLDHLFMHMHIVPLFSLPVLLDTDILGIYSNTYI